MTLRDVPTVQYNSEDCCLEFYPCDSQFRYLSVLIDLNWVTVFLWFLFLNLRDVPTQYNDKILTKNCFRALCVPQFMAVKCLNGLKVGDYSFSS